MRVNRKFLYWGVFLVAVGGVLVAADLNGVDETTIVDWLRLWPLAVVAIGVGIVLRRSRFNVAGGMLAAAVPGLVLGGAFALGPRIAVDCGTRGEPSTFVTREGTFDGPARINVTTGCGSLAVTTAPGTGWLLEAGNTENRMARVESSGTSLSIDNGRRTGWHGFGAGRDVWRLTLPTSTIDALSVVVNAGEGDIDLAGAELGRLDLTTNAGRTTVGLSDASLSTLSGTVNAGKLSVDLPATVDLTGSVVVNAGALEVCVPDGVGLRIHHAGVLGGTSYNGLDQSGSDWQSPDYASAAHRTDLTVTVNFGSVDINPTGGCK
ncbi:MAG: hypothetical protein WEE50_00850 [Chloroflexota bacterium]